MSWLERHLSALASPGALVLELGCGPGVDAAHLTAAGFRVVATDTSPRALARAAEQVGRTALLRVDHGVPLPFRDGVFEAVVASLTLHYFGREATRAVFTEIRRVLRPGGALLFRVNATDDIEHGALDGIEVERNVRTDPHAHYSELKHFFDEADLREVLDGLFVIEEIEHLAIDRNDRTKRIWECRARTIPETV